MELFIKFTVNEMVRACNSGKLEELATIIKVPTEELIESPKKVVTQPKTVSLDDKEPEQVETTEKIEPEEHEEIPTIVDLRAKAQEKGKTAEGKKAIKALLDEFQCKSISNVPEEVRVAFMRKLEVL